MTMILTEKDIQPQQSPKEAEKKSPPAKAQAGSSSASQSTGTSSTKSTAATAQPAQQSGQQSTRPRPEHIAQTWVSPEDRVKKTMLRFSPYAWAKLLFFRDRGDTEIGGFGITVADDMLFVKDFMTVRQNAELAGVEFKDDAVADFLDDQVDAGRSPAQVLRVWCHTHPGKSPHPSSLDESTFSRVFGKCDHAVMFILARGGGCYARMRFNVGPGGDVPLTVEVDYSQPFPASAFDKWKSEYKSNISAVVRDFGRPGMTPGLLDNYESYYQGKGMWPDIDNSGNIDYFDPDEVEDQQPGFTDQQYDDSEFYCLDPDTMEELAAMDPEERAAILAQFGAAMATEDEEYDA